MSGGLTAEGLINGRLRDSTRASYASNLKKMVKWAKYRKDCDNKDPERGCARNSDHGRRDHGMVAVEADVHGVDLWCAGEKCSKRVGRPQHISGW